jgi:hypothetical protein
MKNRTENLKLIAGILAGKVTKENIPVKHDYSKLTRDELVTIAKLRIKYNQDGDKSVTEDDKKTLSDMETAMKTRKPGYGNYTAIKEWLSKGKSLEEAVRLPGIAYPYNNVKAAEKLINDIEDE